ncbi:MAG: helix-turn-helix transcriptional regulator [Achromobacter ruhlandii]|jgi:DNA-binding CsgD family transcriptional regulator|nr:helix-turn-helix transcriptional regulator [Achromobacter ruhlandii]MCI1837745.1 helix-turn-helix transcriptional regulator [Achromobacter ruhlandii]
MPVPRPDLPAILAVLTPREREIVDYIVAGRPNKVIAIDLGISLRTVEAHRARIFTKLGVRNAMRLACRLCAYGHLDGGPPLPIGPAGHVQDAAAGDGPARAETGCPGSGAYAVHPRPIATVIADCSAMLINKGLWAK